jgi:hypothetical protein
MHILLLSLNKSISRVVLNQTFISLTEFIENSVKIYDTKLISLDTP